MLAYQATVILNVKVSGSCYLIVEPISTKSPSTLAVTCAAPLGGTQTPFKIGAKTKGSKGRPKSAGAVLHASHAAGKQAKSGLSSISTPHKAPHFSNCRGFWSVAGWFPNLTSVLDKSAPVAGVQHSKSMAPNPPNFSGSLRAPSL